MKRGQDKCLEISMEYEAYLDGLEEKKKNYIKNRLVRQIEWYDKSAVKYKKCYKMFNALSILLTCILPCLTTLNVKNTIIALISTSSVIITTITNAFDYHNLWIEYRMICERLKSTLHQYMTGTGIFISIPREKRFNMLVVLSEECMSKELKSWNSINREKEHLAHTEKE